MSITLAEILRIKAEKGYSVSKLSEYSGVPVETLRKILAGNTTDTMEADLAALENVLFQDACTYHLDGISPNMVAEHSLITAHRKAKSVRENIRWRIITICLRTGVPS